MLRNLRYGLEGVFILFAAILLRILPLDLASALGGFLGRLAGPFTRAHRTARTNLERALPELSERQQGRILSDMWDNLGRVIGEYPHIMRPIVARRVTIEGREHLQAVQKSGKGAVFVSGHFANWEMGPLITAHHGLPLVVIYRQANNPVADWLIRKIRSYYCRSLHAKGRAGAAQMVRTLKEGNALGLLVDQKMNDGSAVPFFGRPAMTATAAAQLAIKYQVPLLAARVVRTDGVHFHVTIEPPIYYAPDTDPIQAMTEVHRLFERWIREQPAQWFWVHKRWG